MASNGIRFCEKVAQDVSISSTEAFVLTLIGIKSNPSGKSYTGMTYLCQQTHLSRRSISRAIGCLLQKNIIAVEKRYDRDGHRTHDLYHLNFQR
jgi:hypothetical protein